MNSAFLILKSHNKSNQLKYSIDELKFYVLIAELFCSSCALRVHSECVYVNQTFDHKYDSVPRNKHSSTCCIRLFDSVIKFLDKNIAAHTRRLSKHLGFDDKSNQQLLVLNVSRFLSSPLFLNSILVVGLL